MTLEEEFNDIIALGFYGERYVHLCTDISTTSWYKFHGPGNGKEVYCVDNPKAIVNKIKPLLCNLIDKHPALALTSTDPFIREYAQAYMEDVWPLKKKLL